MQGSVRFMRAMRLAAAPVALALLAAAPVHAQTAPTATPGFTPTMADWMAVNDLMHRYRLGVEQHDDASLRGAFWEDGRNIAVPSPGMEIVMPLDGSAPRPPPGFTPPPGSPGGPPAGAGGPPPGMSGPPPGMSGPPPGMSGPPPGMSGPPPGAGGRPGPPDDGYIVWHLPFESSFHFESATRATHYQYFLSIYPEPENPQPGLPARETRRSIVGWPGHYADILEKRGNEWRILERRTYINAK